MDYDSMTKKHGPSAIVEIEVEDHILYSDGPTISKVKVYRSLLEAFASNFARLFQHPGIRAIKLDSVFREVLIAFMQWLRQEYEDTPEAKHPKGIDWEEMEETCLYHDYPFVDMDVQQLCPDINDADLCIEMFLFATTYNIPTLRNDAVSRLRCYFDPAINVSGGWQSMNYISEKLVNRVYDTTDAISPIRRLLVAGLSMVAQHDEYVSADLLVELLLDMIKVLARQSKGARISMPSICDFHEHETKDDKRRCEKYQDVET